jgi:hypothetical protein
MVSILRLHPDRACEAVSAIAVDAARPAPGRLVLRYAVASAGGLLVPPAAAPERTDGLWRHTCFEAFLRSPGAEPYVEINLAPSGQWAAYRFDGYRAGMAPLEALSAPAIEWRATTDGFELTAALDLSRAPDLPPDGAWRLGLSAVIEEASGRSSYWALAHPPGKADFHHPDGFALDLPAP